MPGSRDWHRPRKGIWPDETEALEGIAVESAFEACDEEECDVEVQVRGPGVQEWRGAPWVGGEQPPHPPAHSAAYAGPFAAPQAQAHQGAHATPPAPPQGAKVPLQRVTVTVPGDSDIGGLTFVLRSADTTRWCGARARAHAHATPPAFSACAPGAS